MKEFSPLRVNNLPFSYDIFTKNFNIARFWL